VSALTRAAGLPLAAGRAVLARAAAMPPGRTGHVTNPVTWSGWPWRDGWVPQWDPQSGLELGRASVVYSCVDRVSSALSSMPLRMSRDSTPLPPDPWITNPAPDHYTHIGEAVDEIVWSLLLRGNAYLYPLARYADGYPAQWVVLNPDRVAFDEALQEWTVQTDLGEPLRHRLGQLLHIRHRVRPGRRLGLSPLDAAAANIANVAGYEATAAKLANRSGLPTQGILATDQEITEDTAERYKHKWQARDPGDVAVLGSGLRYESLSLSPRDLALLELREFDGRAIATAFGVPPFMVNLAAAGDLTYSTVQGQMDYFWRATLRPLSVNIGRALGTWLPGRQTVVFDADAYIRPEMPARITAYAEAIAAGVLTVDEARALENLAPLGGLAGIDQAALLAEVTGRQ